MNIIQSSKNTIVVGNKVWINDTLLPPVPCKGSNITTIDDKVYIDGYEYKNGKWKRTLKAFWYLWF